MNTFPNIPRLYTYKLLTPLQCFKTSELAQCLEMGCWKRIVKDFHRPNRSVSQSQTRKPVAIATTLLAWSEAQEQASNRQSPVSSQTVALAGRGLGTKPL